MAARPGHVTKILNSYTVYCAILLQDQASEVCDEVKDLFIYYNNVVSFFENVLKQLEIFPRCIVNFAIVTIRFTQGVAVAVVFSHNVPIYTSGIFISLNVIQITLISKQFVQWDELVTKLEIASQVKKVDD